MEVVSGTVFIGAIIAGVTEAIRSAHPAVKGWVTVAVAAAVGLAVALLDVHIGVENISPAVGIMTGLGAAGVAGIVKKIG